MDRGIEALSHQGAQLRLWIKAQRLEHWGVSREYSRRLRQALQSHNIAIGMPQESVELRPAPASLPISPSDNGGP